MQLKKLKKKSLNHVIFLLGLMNMFERETVKLTLPLLLWKHLKKERKKERKKEEDEDGRQSQGFSRFLNLQNESGITLRTVS